MNDKNIFQHKKILGLEKTTYCERPRIFGSFSIETTKWSHTTSILCPLVFFKSANALDVETISQCGLKTSNSTIIYHHQNHSLEKQSSLSCAF